MSTNTSLAYVVKEVSYHIYKDINEVYWFEHPDGIVELPKDIAIAMSEGLEKLEK